MDDDKVIVITDDEIKPFVDNSKEPKKIYMDYITGDEDDQLTPIWSEKTDYINEKRLGEGLENKIEYLDGRNRTYNLSLKPASKTELGGIKLGNSLSMDEEGIVNVNSNTVINPATETELGGVTIGDNINVDPWGKISVDRYELPTATREKLGGVRIGDGLGIDNGYLSVVCNSLLNFADLTEEEKQLVGAGLTNIDFVINVLLRLHSEQEKEISALKERLNHYVDTTPTVQGKIESGEAVFNGNYDKINKTGGTIVTLDRTYENSEYIVMISPACSVVGEIGDYYIMDKTPNSFRVCNTGSEGIDKFYWVLVPTTVEFSYITGGDSGEDENKLPVQFGTATFNGKEVNSEKNTIVFPKQFQNVNYAVFITPVVYKDGNGFDIGNPSSGNLGEFCVTNKLASECIVLNTGSDKETMFDWVAIPFSVQDEAYNYDSYIFPIHVGSINVLDGKEPDIKFNSYRFNNKNYKVVLQLASNAQGRMGEYFIDEYNKTRTTFKIEHSGNVQQYTMDWITVD